MASTITATATITIPTSALPVGPTGLTGPAGPAGPAGVSPVIDLLALAKLVAPLVAALLAPGTVVTPPPVVITPPPVPAGTFWLYNNGTFTGAGDYNYGNAPYSFTYTNVAAGGGTDCLAQGDMAWQPRMPGDSFNTLGFKYLLVSIRPTQKHGMITGAEMIGDVPIPGSVPGGVNMAAYGPNPMVLNAWNDFKIPLSALSIPDATGITIYKIMFQPQNVPSPITNRVEYDKVGFSPS